jgi:hypothetical protein
METFLDGGLFEILIAMVFAISLNFIFLKKYLLVIFSLGTVSYPIVLFFINRDELYYWLVALCVFNSVFLVVLLWKKKMEKPNEPLFDIDNLKIKLLAIKRKLSTGFQKVNSRKNKSIN